ncbi:oxidoreductase [Shewanella baltica OS223]|uniref:aldo/keto reductase n=1 Tax=Shewanella baltica TaxID=62322 RepID=UPI0001531A2D|nr:aldo/keto reductase [Shewanella baltica]ACK46665.1 oxidoreductase [Shewanella baltica OS223]
MENSVSANSISKPLYLCVSLVALGTGNFGTACGYGADPDTAELIFNAFDEAGGNFIDTADVYQFGQSEELLGKFLQGRRKSQLSSLTAMPLILGRTRAIAVKIMVASVETSLKCLSSIDLGIFYSEIQQLVSSLQVFIQRTLTLSLGT